MRLETCFGKPYKHTADDWSERHTHGEVECAVATVVGMSHWKMLLGSSVVGVDGLHAHIKAQYEVIEVEAQPQTVSHRHFVVKTA